MTTDMDKIKGKIKKLLALGEDSGAFEGEIDNALRFARRLMLKHNVSEEDLAKARDPHEMAADVEYGSTDAYSTTNHMCSWESSLIWAVCELIGTVQWYKNSGAAVRRNEKSMIVYNRAGKPVKAQKFTFYGPDEDVLSARELFAEWSHVVVAMARMRYGSAFKGPGRNYAEGFTRALRNKVYDLHEAERAQIAACPTDCTALVVQGAHQLMAIKRDKAVDWLRETMGITLTSARRGSGRGSFDSAAHSAGAADGAKAEFTHSRRKKLEG